MPGEIAGGEIPHKMPRWKREPDRRQGRAYSNAALSHSALGQPNDVEPRKAFAETNLDLNGVSFDADQACGVRSREHTRLESTRRAAPASSEDADIAEELWRNFVDPSPAASDWSWTITHHWRRASRLRKACAQRQGIPGKAQRSSGTDNAGLSCDSGAGCTARGGCDA